MLCISVVFRGDKFCSSLSTVTVVLDIVLLLFCSDWDRLFYFFTCSLLLFFLYTAVFLCPPQLAAVLIEGNQKTQEHIWTSTSERKSSDFAFFPAAMSCFVEAPLFQFPKFHLFLWIWGLSSSNKKYSYTWEVQKRSPKSVCDCCLTCRDFLGARTGSVKLGLHCAISDMIFTQILIVWLSTFASLLCSGGGGLHECPDDECTANNCSRGDFRHV